MKSSQALIKNNKIYFLGFSAILFTGFLLLLINGKSVSFLSLNAYHPFWLNVFFINYTFVGDGIFALALITLYFLHFRKKQEAMMLLCAFLFSGLAVQLLKNFISAPRPRLFFEPGQYLFFFDHVSLANNSSFPSGHTATAFAIATVLVATTRNKNWQLPLLIAAAGVGFSRIYLAQHFLLDVLIGALIGSIFGILSVVVVKNFRGIKHAFNKLHRIQTQHTVPSPDAIQPV